jgi:hypothetical protein
LLPVVFLSVNEFALSKFSLHRVVCPQAKLVEVKAKIINNEKNLLTMLL